MPVINSNTPTENIQVPVPTPVQPKKQRPPAVIQRQPRPQKPQTLPLSFGGENNEMGQRVQGVSAVILPWSPQPKQLSRKKVVVRYSRPTLTPTQKERAKKVELVVLPKNIEGKKCGTCKYGKRHGEDGLYCTNNQVHMNVKSNWGCKLWDAKGVKRLQRKPIRYAEGEQHLDEEEAFQQHLDQHPEDHNHRMVFADWLQERGDPRAEGYRALGQLGHRPYASVNASNTWVWARQGNRHAADYPKAKIDRNWLKTIVGNHPTYGSALSNNPYWKYHTTRRHADDAAALAFGQLPKHIKARLLSKST